MTRGLLLKNPDLRLPSVSKVGTIVGAFGAGAVIVGQVLRPGTSSTSVPAALSTKMAAPENMTVASGMPVSDSGIMGTTVVQHYGVPVSVFLITVTILVLVQIAVLAWYVRRNSVKVTPSTRLVAVGWQKLDAQESWKIANFAARDIQEELVVTLAAGDDSEYAEAVAQDPRTSALLQSI